MIAGIVVGLLLPLAVGALWYYLQQENAKLAAEGANLDGQISQLAAKQKEIEAIDGQIAQVQEETNSLAGVFNQIKSWSALLQDVRERVPPGVQIASIQQVDVAAPAAAASPSPSPNAQAAPTVPQVGLEIQGTAGTFNDVNDFVLTLQQSQFLQKDKTQLVSAELVANPITLEQQPANSGSNQPTAQITVELPKVVQYKIKTNLTDAPASDLLRELERKGSVGLVTRIRTLQQKGVIK